MAFCPMRPAPPPDPSGLVLLVIDVQNGFATYGDERDRKPGYVDTASSHVPAIAAFCRRWLQSGLPLVVARSNVGSSLLAYRTV